MKKYYTSALSSLALISAFNIGFANELFSQSMLSSIDPTAATTIIGVKCPGCSGGSPGTFSLTFRLYQDNNCEVTLKTFTFSSEVFSDAKTYYLTSTGLDNYANATPAITGVQCMTIAKLGSSTFAQVSGGSGNYTRTFPVPPASANVLSLS